MTRDITPDTSNRSLTRLGLLDACDAFFPDAACDCCAPSRHPRQVNGRTLRVPRAPAGSSRAGPADGRPF
jgi:hypothetical protein